MAAVSIPRRRGLVHKEEFVRWSSGSCEVAKFGDAPRHQWIRQVRPTGSAGTKRKGISGSNGPPWLKSNWARPSLTPRVSMSSRTIDQAQYISKNLVSWVRPRTGRKSPAVKIKFLVATGYAGGCLTWQHTSRTGRLPMVPNLDVGYAYR